MHYYIVTTSNKKLPVTKGIATRSKKLLVAPAPVAAVPPAAPSGAPWAAPWAARWAAPWAAPWAVGSAAGSAAPWPAHWPEHLAIQKQPPVPPARSDRGTISLARTAPLTAVP